MRTIVCSDIHGRSHVLDAIVRHARYSIGVDRLVVAGDLNDDRDGDQAVLELLEALEADVLVGNHELWKLDGRRDYEGLPVRSTLVLDKVLSRQWSMATTVDDILVTHAGVSRYFAERWNHQDSNAATISKWLNQTLRLVAMRFREDEPIRDEQELIEGHGPVWYYPDLKRWPLDSIRQITGHRVPGYQVSWELIAAFEDDGFYHVDPGVRVWEYEEPQHTHIRYAVVEDGEVEIVDESL